MSTDPRFKPGAKPSPWTQEDKNEVLTYVRNGVGRREIVQLTGVPAATVSRWAKAADLHFERQPSPESIEAVKKDSAERRQIKLGRLLDEIDAGIDRLSREPNAIGFRSVAQGIAALAKSYAEIKRFAPDNTSEDAKSILGDFVANIARAAEVIPRMNDTFSPDEATEPDE